MQKLRCDHAKRQTKCPTTKKKSAAARASAFVVAAFAAAAVAPVCAADIAVAVDIGAFTAAVSDAFPGLQKSTADSNATARILMRERERAQDQLQLASSGS